MVCYRRSNKKEKSNENSSLKFEIRTINSSLCDYSDAYILVIDDAIVPDTSADTDAAFKNRAPFSTCRTEIKDPFLDKADHIYITMSMYNLIEYSVNHSDT